MANNIVWNRFENPVELVVEFLRYVNNDYKNVAKLQSELIASSRNGFISNCFDLKTPYKKTKHFFFNVKKHFFIIKNRKIEKYVREYCENITFKNFEDLNDLDSSIIFCSIIRANLIDELREKSRLASFIKDNLRNVSNEALNVTCKDINDYLKKFESQGFVQEDYAYRIRIQKIIKEELKGRFVLIENI